MALANGTDVAILAGSGATNHPSGIHHAVTATTYTKGNTVAWSDIQPLRHSLRKNNVPGPYMAAIGTDVVAVVEDLVAAANSPRFRMEWATNSLQAGMRWQDVGLLENNQGGSAVLTVGNFRYATLAMWGQGVYLTVERITNPALWKISAICFLDVAVTKTAAFQWLEEAA